MTLLAQFEVSEKSGFLPENDPLETLGSDFQNWESVAQNLPKYLVGDSLRKTVDELKQFPTDKLKSRAEEERAMLLLSYIGHGYVWGEKKVIDNIPSTLAVPWHALAKKLGRPPVLSYASYALHNWKRLDKNRPVALGNIALIQNFLGGIDEEWFILIHVEIEQLATAAIRALPLVQDAVAKNDASEANKQLQNIAKSAAQMYDTLVRMTENCDPYIYYNRVRPYIHGWKNNPALPNGLTYKGVKEYNNQPQQFRGETGAQSSIVPCLDAVLGIGHEDGPLKQHLLEMREYMPPKHRDFMAHIDNGPSVRDLVIKNKNNDQPLRNIYNECVTTLEKFRALHLKYAASYIQQQSQTDSANPNAVGTGGTPFMKYLEKHRGETARFIV